ncbi:hypothetical protein L3Q82_026062 [Scortum barcoo]|uniref:Uncharacterized protein n=1 Tax=Scortum barcoo TaxID=214431 RepID=A0ACB8WMP0_9TELE|nr:hypothetical protein L3Q82_026062 [Scortum barcoo]
MASSSGNDDDLTIPRAAINKMIKETLPNVRVANDARELVVNCCTEFIHLISSEANEICNKSDKKTISPEHVINALESLGFASYITEVKDVLQECKTVALKRRKASSRLENLGIPEEELLRQQQELFAKVQADKDLCNPPLLPGGKRKKETCKFVLSFCPCICKSFCRD